MPCIFLHSECFYVCMTHFFPQTTFVVSINREGKRALDLRVKPYSSFSANWPHLITLAKWWSQSGPLATHLLNESGHHDLLNVFPLWSQILELGDENEL